MTDSLVGCSYVILNFPKLKGSSNWRAWERSLNLALQSEGLDYVLTADTPSAASSQKDITDFKVHDSKTRALIGSKCEDGPLHYVYESKTAKEAYDTLKRQYAETGFTARYTVFYKLRKTTISSPGIDGDLEAYISAHTLLRSDLKALDNTIPDWTFCSILINNLEGRYDTLVYIVLSKKDLPTFDTLSSQLSKGIKALQCV